MTEQLPRRLSAVMFTDLTPVQQGVLERLLAGDTVAAAARATNVDRSTVHGWLKDSTFQAAYVNAERDAAKLEWDEALRAMPKGRRALVMLCSTLGGLLLGGGLFALFAVEDVPFGMWFGVTPGFALK